MPKKVYNNFYFFMLEKKNDYSKKGIKYTMKQMSAIASPFWQKLTKEERARYDDMAKAYKNKERNIDGFGDRLASDGTKISDNFKEEEMMEKEIQCQRLEIRTLIGANLDDVERFKRNVIGLKFYVMAFNYACKVEEDDTFIPIEIGLVEYSIQDGITNSYHNVIDFGPVPTGYFNACKTHSEDYHKLFLNKEVPREKNYHKIWSDIMQFLQSDEDQLPPIFTDHASFEVEQTSGCLRWLAEKTNHLRVWQRINIWSLAYLLYELREAVKDPLPMSIAIDLFTSSSFDYTAGINCDFHEQEDSIYCAVGAAKRKSFLLSDAVCDLFDVVLTNNHIPNRASADSCIYVPPRFTKQESSVPRTVRVGDKVELNKPKPRCDALDDFDSEEEEDPPQPVFPSRALGRGLSLQASKPTSNNAPSHTQLNQQFANMGIGRGRGIIHK